MCNIKEINSNKWDLFNIFEYVLREQIQEIKTNIQP